jgi:hypothetical protein
MGTLEREEIDRENQRQAILNRLNTESAESMAQSRRLAAEDAEHKKFLRLREMQTYQSTLKAYKGLFEEHRPNLDPSLYENAGVDTYKAITEFFDQQKEAERDDAAIAASKASVRASDAALANSVREDERQSKIDAAAELAANPDFFNLVMFEQTAGGGGRGGTGAKIDKPRGEETVFDERTLKIAIEERFPGKDPQVTTAAYQALRGQRDTMDALRQKQQGVGEPPKRNEVNLNADKLIAFHGGDRLAAIEDMKTRILENKGDMRRMMTAVLNNMIKAVEAEGGDVNDLEIPQEIQQALDAIN